MQQSWHDLLFAHWPVPLSVLRPLIPPKLEVDTFYGTGWIGIIPFRMTRIRPRYLPPVPRLSAFPELNVRTYVHTRDYARDHAQDRTPVYPGVYFFSLDAGNPVAVAIARRVFHLPYYWADMHVQDKGFEINYQSRRIHRGAEPAHFTAHYEPTDGIYHAMPASLEHWLTERYCLYATFQGRLYRAQIHHLPWPLQPATADIQAQSMASAARITLPDTDPILHFARRLDVLVWPLRPVDSEQVGSD